MCYTHLKLALLLHKQGLVATGVGTTAIVQVIDGEREHCFRFVRNACGMSDDAVSSKFSER